MGLHAASLAAQLAEGVRPSSSALPVLIAVLTAPVTCGEAGYGARAEVCTTKSNGLAIELQDASNTLGKNKDGLGR